MDYLTPKELVESIGDSLKKLRLLHNIDQATLASQAGVSTRTLQKLENGEGSSLISLVRVVKALGREEWFDTIAPIPTINPLTLTAKTTQRVRARKLKNSANR